MFLGEILTLQDWVTGQENLTLERRIERMFSWDLLILKKTLLCTKHLLDI